MKEKSPAVQWYPKQYLGDDNVIAMEWDARGMHHWLLNISWQQDPPGTLPNDDALIRRWLGSPSEDIWRRVKPQIMRAWSVQGDRLANSGMVRAWERQQKFSASRTKSANARYENSTKKPRETYEHIEDEEEVVPAVEVVPEKTKVVAATFSLRGPTHAELICAEYPLKVGMADALMQCDLALTRLMNGEMGGAKMSAGDAKFFLDGRVKAYAKAMKSNLKFCPDPEKWFKKSRYLDDEEAWYAREAATSKSETRTANNIKAVLRSRGEDAGVRRRDVPDGDRGRADHDVEGTAE